MLVGFDEWQGWIDEREDDGAENFSRAHMTEAYNVKRHTTCNRYDEGQLVLSHYF